MIATIADVANVAKVSRTTVSRYLNGQVDLNSDTAKRIRQAIAQLRYRPNLLARSLRSTISRSAAVIVPDLRNPFYPELLSAIERNLAPHGMQVFVGQSSNDALRESEMLKDYAGRQVEAIIYVPASSEASIGLREIVESISVIILDEEVHGLDLPVVRVDHESGTYRATRYLLDLGHARLGYISGPEHLITTQLRIKGFRSAINERREQVMYQQVVSGGYGIDSGNAWVEQLVVKAGVTALLCANDLVALGVHRKLHEMNLSVPEDVSIVGFDDIFPSMMVSPRLTTVRQPLEQIGWSVTQQVIDGIRMGRSSYSRVILEPELVVRESTAPPKS